MVGGLRVAVEAAVCRRAGESREFSYVSLATGREARGRAEVVKMLKAEDTTWQAILACRPDDQDIKAFVRQVKEQISNVQFEQVKEEKRSCIGNGVVDMETETDNKQQLKVEPHSKAETSTERKPFFLDRDGAETLLNVKKEEAGDESEEEDEEQYDKNQIEDIIHGKIHISIKKFKMLMETGVMVKKDLEHLRNVRVVEVQGQGEVIQFLASTTRDFNKVNLKDLNLEDVEPTSIAGKGLRRYIAQETVTELSNLVVELVSKRGELFLCKSCGISTNSVANMANHIITSHSSGLPNMRLEGTGGKERKHKGKIFNRVLRDCVGRTCNPDMKIQQVKITEQKVKQTLKKDTKKSHELNIYQKAADLTCSIIELAKEGNSRRYFCKQCMFELDGGERGCMVHLRNAHPLEVRAWGVALRRAVGPQLETLLREGLRPGLMACARKE